MSRRRKTKAKKEPQLEPEEVLDGNVEVKVEDLFDLIHRVNPTRERAIPARRRRISKQEQTRRYALKNRLQSLLIRRFGDDHLKVQTTEQTGVVSLEHISGLRDACHTITAELEPDARSWVQHQLDLAAHGDEALELPMLTPEAPDRETGFASEIAELLERGQKALDEYDYQRGEELLKQAFEDSLAASDGVGDTSAAAAAGALLELHIDLLGTDEAALELEARLPSAVKRRPGIRTLLALAAARAGDVERALEQIAGLTPGVAGVSRPRAAEVYAALTSQAIGARDSRTARQYLEQVVELDPTHAGIPAFESDIDRLRAEDLSAVETELERRFRELGAAAVEAQARDLADRWPEGEVARRILRQAAAERRQAGIDELLELGERARESGRFDEAARHFQAALDAGCERPELPALAAELAELAQEERERSAVADVLRRLAEAADRRDALLAYLALADELRPRVHAEVELPALGWLDEIDPPRAGAKAQAAVTAVLALERASAALEHGEAEAAAGLIEPHRAVLGRVEHARDLGREARRQIADRRRRRALETLAAAIEAFDQGRPDDARRRLAAVARGDLEAGDHARIQDLQARIDGLGALERLEHEHEERLAAGDLAGALARARRLVEESAEDAAGARRWSRAAAEVQERLRVAWRFEVLDHPVAADGHGLTLAEAIEPSRWREKSVDWLDDDGRELVLANAWGRWLFIDAVDLARDRITARVSLRAPGNLKHPLLTYRDGDRLWITSGDGDVLEIAREGWRILGFYPVRELLAGERHAERARPMPGGRWLWVEVSDWGLFETHLVDLREWRLARKLPPHGAKWIQIPGDDPRMLVSGRGFATRVYSAAGELTSPEPLVQESVIDADLGPDGRGLLLMLSEPLAEEEDYDLLESKRHMGIPPENRILARFTETSDGTLHRSARYELSTAHRYYIMHSVVTSPEQVLSFALLYTEDDAKEILIFSGDGPPERLEPSARSRWPVQTTLAHDRHRRHVAALWIDRDLQLRFLDLTTRPPAEAHEDAEPGFPSYEIYGTRCSWPTGSFGATVQELAEKLGEQGLGSLRTHLARVEASETESVDDQLLVALALRRIERARELHDAIEGFARRMAGRHPEHAGVVLLLADIEAMAGSWDEAGRLMRRADPAELDAPRARHFHHIEGLAHLYGGRLGDAHEAFRRGASLGGYCALEPLIALTRPMADPPDAGDWGPDQPRIRRLAGAVRVADRALAAGDPVAARAALDRRDLRWQQEIQSAARRANAYLEGPPAERFDERAALAFYIQLRRDDDLYTPHNLFLPGISWDEERLAELEEQAVARLDEL